MRGEPKTFLFLVHLDDWQPVDAERSGDFAAVMDIMFEYTPVVDGEFQRCVRRSPTPDTTVPHASPYL
jgi:hypothetical protein